MDEKPALVVFQDKNIRRVWHDSQWHFSVVDIIQALTDSPSPRQYWGVLKGREPQLLTICLPLKLPAEDGKLRFTDCVTTRNAFRLIQSIPSKRAEPFKQWLAEVGYQRVEEIQNPELAQDRMKVLYEQKGYSKDWIDKRLRGIAIRQELTDEWKVRGVEQDREFAILTNEISHATFGKTVEEYKAFKGLKKENLRDHMTDLELIFTMLGERVSAEITRSKDARGFVLCKGAAREGGGVAGRARRDAERQIGSPVVTEENYLAEPEKLARKKLPKQ